MTPSGRIQELDGVRGCAIALVLSWHFVFSAIQAVPPTYLSYVQVIGRLTWSGVDLFFVLSGFLIGGILIDSRDSQNYFRTFYARRFYRIVPLYIVVLCVIRVVNSGTIDYIRWYYFAFLQNFWMAAYATFGVHLAATWSLAVEEQFYLTLPTVVRLVNPKHLIRIIAAGIVVAPCLRILLFFRWPSNPYLSYVLMPCRADALLLGVLGAIAMRNSQANQWLRNNGRTLRMLLLLFAVGAGLLTKYATSWTTIPMRTVGYTWLAGLYLCVILYVLTQGQSWLAQIMRLRWLCWLGSIAYGVYLIHPIIGDLIFRRFRHSDNLRLNNWGDIAAMATSLALTLIVCRISWLTFEKPLLQLGHRYSYGATKTHELSVPDAARV